MSNDAPAIDTARREVLDWLRKDHRNPLFLQSHEDSEGSATHEEIADRFLGWVGPLGFTLEAVNDGNDGEPKWTGHWRFRENHLVGFKQPRYANSREDAALLACAALLENEWCRSRLS